MTSVHPITSARVLARWWPVFAVTLLVLCRTAAAVAWTSVGPPALPAPFHAAVDVPFAEPISPRAIAIAPSGRVWTVSGSTLIESAGAGSPELDLSPALATGQWISALATDASGDLFIGIGGTGGGVSELPAGDSDAAQIVSLSGIRLTQSQPSASIVPVGLAVSHGVLTVGWPDEIEDRPATVNASSDGWWVPPLDYTEVSTFAGGPNENPNLTTPYWATPAVPDSVLTNTGALLPFPANGPVSSVAVDAWGDVFAAEDTPSGVAVVRTAERERVERPATAVRPTDGPGDTRGRAQRGPLRCARKRGAGDRASGQGAHDSRHHRLRDERLYGHSHAHA